MLSPTGQFIAPSSCPGSILVDFLTTHLDEATKLIAEYKKFLFFISFPDTMKTNFFLYFTEINILNVNYMNDVQKK